MTGRRLRDACEHLYMLAVGFFLLWNVFYMTEAQWTFDVRGAFPGMWLGLAAAALVLGRFRTGAGGWLLALPVWMLIASAYRGAEVLAAQTGMIARAVLAFGVMLPVARIVRRERFGRYMRGILALWTACMTLQALIGLWAALTGHAVFSLKGTWYIGVNLGDHRLYLNAYVTTGAVKLGLSVLLAVLGMLISRKGTLKIVYGFCMVVQLACLSLTDCRTAFIAVGASLGLTLAVGIWHAGTGKRCWLRIAAAMCAVLLLAAGVYAGLSGLLTALSPHVPQELENLTLTELPAHLLPEAAAEGAVQHRELQADNLFNDRQVIWRAAFRLLRSEPEYLLTGTTMALSPALTNLYVAPTEFTGRPFAHVHNIYLQVLVAWGLPGALLLAAFLVAFFRAAWRVMLRHRLPLWQRIVPVPVLYVMLCEMVDCFTRLSEDSPLLLFACLLAGLTLVTDARATREARADAPLITPVDVIIPVYNAAEYVRRAAASVLATPGARLILVDDGSTDGSGAICDDLAADERVTVLHQENRGASAARNAGLAAASADHVAFLDADDELFPGALPELVRCMEGADAIQGAVLRNDPETLPYANARLSSGREALAKAMRSPTRHLLCHGWLFRRSLLTEHFNEELTMGEDGEWMLRVLRGAGKVAMTGVPVYRYTVRPDSAIHSGSDVQADYLRTLRAAGATLQTLHMPQEAALYRLMHLLLILVHGDLTQMEELREAEPFAEAFSVVRLKGVSPGIVTLWLLKWRAYLIARLAIRIRRVMNGWSMRHNGSRNAPRCK